MNPQIKCPQCGASLMLTDFAKAIGKADCPVCAKKFLINTANAAEPHLLARCRLASGTPVLLSAPINGSNDFDIQWMPPGEQSPVVFVGDEARQLNFTVKPEHAQAFNSQLQRLIELAKAGTGDLPFVDFNHEDGAASGRPVEFYWGGDDAKKGGIRLKGTWSASGKAAITGPAPEYTRFSPEWYFDEDGTPIAIGPNLGGLVNRAAFKTIASVTARDASERFKGHAKASDLDETTRRIMATGETHGQFAQAQARKLNPAAAVAFDAAKNELDQHPFKATARQLASERQISQGEAEVHLAKSDFPLYQSYLAAHGKFSRKVMIPATGSGGQRRFLTAVRAKQAEGLDFEKATAHVAGNQPHLYEEYRRSFQ